MHATCCCMHDMATLLQGTWTQPHGWCMCMCMRGSRIENAPWTAQSGCLDSCVAVALCRAPTHIVCMKQGHRRSQDALPPLGQSELYFRVLASPHHLPAKGSGCVSTRAQLECGHGTAASHGHVISLGCRGGSGRGRLHVATTNEFDKEWRRTRLDAGHARGTGHALRQVAC